MLAPELRAARIADLKDKLKAREGKPGMASNVDAIKAQLSALEDEAAFRDKDTGEFVSVEFAIQNPGLTERVE